jgi:hypothetical protein
MYKTVIVANRLRHEQKFASRYGRKHRNFSALVSNRDKKEGLPEYKAVALPTETVVAAVANDPNPSLNSSFLARYKFSHSIETDDTTVYVNIPVTGVYPERIHLLIL